MSVLTRYNILHNSGKFTDTEILSIQRHINNKRLQEQIEQNKSNKDIEKELLPLAEKTIEKAFKNLKLI